jgi:hypothetical protein
MADDRMSTTGEELLLDVRVAEASRLYKFYLNQERKILGTISVALFLLAWELVGNTFQLINPMFMSAPSLIWKAAVQLFGSGEIWNLGGAISYQFLSASPSALPSVGIKNSLIFATHS